MTETNLEIVKRDTKTYVFTLTRKSTGAAIDISGWYCYFTVKEDFNDLDASALISKDVLFPSNAESEAGIGYLTLSSTETNIAIGDYYYDMKFVDTDYRETFMSGKLNIIYSVRTA
jgi:hypothetical protein